MKKSRREDGMGRKEEVDKREEEESDGWIDGWMEV